MIRHPTVCRWANRCIGVGFFILFVTCGWQILDAGRSSRSPAIVLMGTLFMVTGGWGLFLAADSGRNQHALRGLLFGFLILWCLWGLSAWGLQDGRLAGGFAVFASSAVLLIAILVFGPATPLQPPAFASAREPFTDTDARPASPGGYNERGSENGRKSP
ncbi:MAG: hypothetical protein AB7K09_16065 [Planctomycetota bacterium]